MAKSQPPEGPTRYTKYGEDPRSIIRTVNTELTALETEPEDIVYIQVAGAEATGFIVLYPPLSSVKAETESGLIIGHETPRTVVEIEDIGLQSTPDTLEKMDDYLEQYWKRFDAYRIDISPMYTEKLRQPVKEVCQKALD